ncbi:MAG: 3-phosphoserine/phosphohydroxythreonine transaminase [Pseudomonadota bacterium]
MSRIYNFSAGPAALPQAVLERARDELLEWQDAGASVMELSHRSKAFLSIAQAAEADLRELLAIPEHYKVLFLQGGATAQFAMVPLNLLPDASSRADYVDTGSWSAKAIKEAGRYGDVQVVASSKDTQYDRIPAPDQWQVRQDAAYLHYTPNETIGGVEFHWVPEVSDAPLVVDMSSTLLSRPIDVSRFGLIYAGAQKNIGPAGLTLVIVREDLLDRARASTPAMLNYATHAKADSMANTPPTYAWYLAGLVFQWLKAQGGLDTMARVNERKAQTLYGAIDGSDFYRSPVAADCRSWMNVPFTLPDAELDGAFLAGAEEAGLSSLKGHRSVGGMRASLYNAMPQDGVDALVAYMQDFERRHG